MDPKHVYLVAYMHDKGYGRAIVHLVDPIRCEADILKAEILLKNKNGFECSIFTYQLIETKE